MLIYDWGTQPGYLAFHLWPAASVFQGHPLDTSSEVIEKFAGSLTPEEPVLLHICLSQMSGWHARIEEATDWLIASGHTVLNVRLGDVSKRRIQQLNIELNLPTTQIEESADGNTKVIIKTDRNYAGISERRLNIRERDALGLLAGDPRIAKFDRYEICTLNMVTPQDRSDGHLVVERFVENPLDRIFRFYRNGTRRVLTEAINPDPIKKMIAGLQRTNHLLFETDTLEDPLHSHINGNCLRFCEAIGMEYGTLDIVVDGDDTPYIIDANPTPGWGEEFSREC